MFLDVDCTVVVAAALLNSALAGGVVEGALALRAADSAAFDLVAELLGGVSKAVDQSRRGVRPRLSQQNP